MPAPLCVMGPHTGVFMTIGWGRLKWVAIGALVLLAAGTASAAERYLCIADKSTGFKWNGREWASVNFDVSGVRYIVQETTEERRRVNPQSQFTVTKMGEKDTIFTCRRGDSGGNTTLRVICGGLAWGMVIDTEALRFQKHYTGGFLDGDEPDNTPNLTIGKCSPLD
jgi:hypothetical protein